MTVPPLLLLAQGRKPRPRKAPSVGPSEFQIQASVVKILRQFATPGWQFCHIANGEVRDKRTAAKLKAMGVQAGWPDLILVPPTTGQMHALELKAKGGKLSPEQETFKLWAARHGLPYAVAYSVDEALVALSAWGALDDRVKLFGGAK